MGLRIWQGAWWLVFLIRGVKGEEQSPAAKRKRNEAKSAHKLDPQSFLQAEPQDRVFFF